MRRGLACFGVVMGLLVSVVPSALALTQPPNVPEANRGAIRIDGDDAFTTANGVTGGRGTASKPYTIEGWNISAAGGDAITILGTTAYFLIHNVTVHSGGQTYAGIRLSQTTNGRVENDLLYDCGPALAIDGSSNILVKDSSFTANYASAWVSSSTSLSFTGNQFRSGGGMEFSDSTWVNVTGNTATDPQFRVGTDPYGSGAQYNISENTISGIQTNVFELNGIDGIVVEGNRISATGPGIVVQRSANVSVYGNIVSAGAWGGIDIGESRHVLLERNTVSNVVPGHGINVALSSDVVVAENDLTNNEQGIALQGNLNVIATGNRIAGSGFWIDADTLDEYRSVNATNNTVNGLPFVAERGCRDLVLDRGSGRRHEELGSHGGPSVRCRGDVRDPVDRDEHVRRVLDRGARSECPFDSRDPAPCVRERPRVPRSDPVRVDARGGRDVRRRRLRGGPPGPESRRLHDEPHPRHGPRHDRPGGRWVPRLGRRRSVAIGPGILTGRVPFGGTYVPGDRGTRGSGVRDHGSGASADRPEVRDHRERPARPVLDPAPQRPCGLFLPVRRHVWRDGRRLRSHSADPGQRLDIGGDFRPGRLLRSGRNLLGPIPTEQEATATAIVGTRDRPTESAGAAGEPPPLTTCTHCHHLGRVDADLARRDRGGGPDHPAAKAASNACVRARSGTRC